MTLAGAPVARNWKGSRPLVWVDLTAVPAQEQRAAVEQQAARWQMSLDLRRGPLLRLAYFDLGAGQSARLLLVAHHLAMDGVSWRALLEDLQAAYEQTAAGNAIQLPPKTTSFRHWAQRLQEYAASEALRAELGYWLAVVEPQAGRSVARLRPDMPGGENTEASAQSVSVTLTAQETDALLHQVPQAYRAEVNDVLLTALAQTLTRCAGASDVVVALEGHGREELFDDIDLSRTVGWFTSLFPVRLSVAPTDGPGDALKAVKEQLRRVPQRGIGYGLLRYLCPDAEVRARLQADAGADVALNYLGQMDQALGQSWFVPAQEQRGPDRCPRGKRAHLLDITGGVIGGQLRLEWTYSANLHRRDTIEALADEFLVTLRDLIAHCSAPEAGGFTASDFEEFGWSEEDLGDILGELGKLGPTPQD
jgi:non-ribosomal peptide synthase protein (TIGR01720 family)